jgi:tetratricopeptide (TPR) repeat protein
VVTLDHIRDGLTVCERTLGIYQILEQPDWERNPDWHRLSSRDRQRLAEDTRELLLLLAWGRVKTTSREPAVLRQALVLLDRAEAIQGLTSSPALAADRAFYLSQLGDEAGAAQAREAAQQRKPTTARDHYLLALSRVHGSAAEPASRARALAELDEAVRLDPTYYWAWLQKGLCHEELGAYAAAAADFGVCVGLSPEFSYGYFNRGYALARSGHTAEALADYTAALERDPHFLLAYLNRGTTRLTLNQYENALEDFTRAAELAQDDTALLSAHNGRGLALEALGRIQEADAAFASAFAPGRVVADDIQCRERIKYGFAVHARLPGKARTAFADALRHNPQDAQALYGQGMLLVEQADQSPEALSYLTRALKADPRLFEAHRFRGILLARLGRFDEAGQDINWCLEHEESGPNHYAAACVSALLARAWANKKATEYAKEAENQALGFLQAAFARGYGREKAAKDPDLAALWQQPGFKQLLEQRP